MSLSVLPFCTHVYIYVFEHLKVLLEMNWLRNCHTCHAFALVLNFEFLWYAIARISLLKEGMCSGQITGLFIITPAVGNYCRNDTVRQNVLCRAFFEFDINLTHC